MKRYDRLAAAAGALVAALGAVVLLAWLLDVQALKSLSPGWVTMKANTALSFLLVGSSLVLLSRGRRRVAVGLAGAAAVLPALTLVEYASGYGLWIDQFLFDDPAAVSTSSAGRMSPLTAGSFVVIALSVLGAASAGHRRAAAAQVGAVIVISVGLLISIGDIYGAGNFTGATTTRMAAHTALAFIAVGVALLALTAQATRASEILFGDGPGGLMTRRLLPVAVLAPVFLGGVDVAFGRLGVGENTAPTAGLALLGIFIVGAVVLVTALALSRTEAARGRAAATLGRKHEQLRAVLDQMPGGLVMVDAATRRLVMHSATARAIVGERLDGQSIVDYWLSPCFHPDGRLYEAHDYPLARALRDGEIVSGEQLVYERERGDKIALEVSAAPVRDAGGRIALGLCTFTDVSSRKHAEEDAAIARAELDRLATDARFRGLLESAPDAMVIVDERAEIVVVNAETERLFGYRRAQLVGRRMEMLMPDRFRLAHGAHAARFLETRQMGAGLELCGLRKDGTEFPIDVSLSSLEVDGETLLVSSIRDVSERRQSEESLRRLTAELTVTNEQLEAFAYSVSHDLRAPLRAIRGFARILSEQHASALADDGLAALHRIAENAERMGGLIDGLLRLSRLTQASLERRPVDVNSLVDAVLADAVNGNVVDFTRHDLPVCDADAALLEQVFANLLSNALKFSAERDPALIEVGSLVDSSPVVYFVRDNGVGFDMRHAEGLFGVFHRLHRVEDYDGSGIGLATVQRIVHRHGGEIWAEAEPGRGATFYFTLEEACP